MAGSFSGGGVRGQNLVQFKLKYNQYVLHEFT